MKKNKAIYTKLLCKYLNLLAEKTIFHTEVTQRFHDDEDMKVTITCKNTAYINELNLLTLLLDGMTAICDDRVTTVEIS